MKTKERLIHLSMLLVLIGLTLSGCHPKGNDNQETPIVRATISSPVTQEESALTSQVCGEQIAQPVPFGSLESTDIEILEPGFSSEWFVEPGAFNMPEEVFLTPSGDILVYEVRGHALHELHEDGTASLLVDGLWGYLGAVDQEGNIYLHMHPDGLITRISPPSGYLSELNENPITIDGDPSDWEGIPALLYDLQDDHLGGGVDIKAVYAFVDDIFLYVLIDTYEPPTDFIQIDLGITTANEQYNIGFHPQKNPAGFLGKISNIQFEQLGKVDGGRSAVGAAIEYALPLAALGDIAVPLEIIVRPMAGTCCQPPDWYAIDEVSPVKLSQPDQWTKTIIAQSPELQTACDSGVGFGPDGNLYIAVSRCTNKGDLYQVTTDGKFTKLAQVPQLQALRTDSQGRFIAAGWGAVYELSLSDFSLEQIASVPGSHVSPGGLAFDDQDNIYVSTGSRSDAGAVYRISRDGAPAKVAKIPKNGLTGIEWLSDSSEIIGGQLRQGGIIAVAMDGSIRAIVTGSGVLTPMSITVSPCGELAVPNDEGMMMILIDQAGQVSWLMDYVSFIPPIPHVAFKLDGTLFASEGAPGFPGRVVTLAPGNHTPEVTFELNYPCGLAFSADGDLFVSSSTDGKVVRIDTETPSQETFAEGLNFPQGIAFNADGDMFVITDPPQFFTPVPDVNPAPTTGDKILRITPDGEVHTFAEINNMIDIAFSPEGELFATVGGIGATAESMVIKISPDGLYSTFAKGFTSVSGLAFDLAGNLYVADEHNNGIIRIGGFPQGILCGRVEDEAGNPLADTRVQVYTDDPLLVGQVVATDSQGNFSLPAAPRVYTLIISADGFVTYTEEDIIVSENQETTLNFILES